MTEQNAAELLASCKELCEALAGAMRVLFAKDLTDDFIDEMTKVGIADGIGVRADAAIAKAEGR